MTTLTEAKIEQSQTRAVVRFKGDIASTSEEAVLGSYRRLAAEIQSVALDFTKVPYLNSSGIALLIQLLMAAHKAGRRVVCFGLSAHFVKVFTMLGLAKYTSLHASETEALAALGG